MELLLDTVKWSAVVGAAAHSKRVYMPSTSTAPPIPAIKPPSIWEDSRIPVTPMPE